MPHMKPNRTLIGASNKNEPGGELARARSRQYYLREAQRAGKVIAKGDALKGRKPWKWADKPGGDLKGRDTILLMPQSLANVLAHLVFSTKDRTPHLRAASSKNSSPTWAECCATSSAPSSKSAACSRRRELRSTNDMCGTEGLIAALQAALASARPCSRAFALRYDMVGPMGLVIGVDGDCSSRGCLWTPACRAKRRPRPVGVGA